MAIIGCLVIVFLAALVNSESESCAQDDTTSCDQVGLLQRAIARDYSPTKQSEELLTPLHLESSGEYRYLTSTSSNVVFSEDFEEQISASSWCWYTKSWCKDLEVVSDGCMSSDKCLRIAYHPTSRGSERLQQKKALPGGIKTATLSFGVYFESDFEWVKGGKLGAGLFGGEGTTGCKPIVPGGWSNRLMWKRDGELLLYMYHQKRASTCGDYVYAKIGSEKFHFEKTRWYKISVSMTLNDPPSEDNGDASLYVDGELAAHVSNIQWRATDGAFIDNMGLSTFYGGSSPSWAPSDTTHVRYDNFQVTTPDSLQATTSQVTTTTTKPTPNTECAKKWKKCGGKKWDGPTCCIHGLVCVKKNEWFSQCRPS